MTAFDVRALLEEIGAGDEFILVEPASAGRPEERELAQACRQASREAVAAYGVWRASRARDAYVAYRAAADRADAAQDALAAARARASRPALPAPPREAAA